MRFRFSAVLFFLALIPSIYIWRFVWKVITTPLGFISILDFLLMVGGIIAGFVLALIMLVSLLGILLGE